MKYVAIVKDNWEVCPGTINLGTFATRKEAQWAIDREVEAAAELFEDGRAQITGEIITVQ